MQTTAGGTSRGEFRQIFCDEYTITAALPYLPVFTAGTGVRLTSFVAQIAGMRYPWQFLLLSVAIRFDDGAPRWRSNCEALGEATMPLPAVPVIA